MLRCVYVCALLYVPNMFGECVLSHNQYLACSSGTAAAVQPQPCLLFLPVVPPVVVGVHVCMVGAQQEIEPRQHFRVQFSVKHVLSFEQYCSSCPVYAKSCEGDSHWSHGWYKNTKQCQESDEFFSGRSRNLVP